MKYIKKFLNFLWNDILKRKSTVFGLFYLILWHWYYRIIGNPLWTSGGGGDMDILVVATFASITPTAIAGIIALVLFIKESKSKMERLKSNALTENKFYIFLFYYSTVFSF